MCVRVYHVTECLCRDQSTVHRSWFACHHVIPGDHTQVVRLSSKHLYPLSHLINPESPFEKRRYKYSESWA